jgi:UDPglucose--hexose-1-phosphate uridylyltransferase
MPELRQNIITREWVIIATERARRPDEFIRPKKAVDPLPAFEPGCAFCPGNESMSAVETYRVADRDGWQVRVVENKFPALSREGDRVRRIDGVYRSMSGVGFHEVVVEHRRHDLSPALYSVEDLKRILVAYRSATVQIRKDRGSKRSSYSRTTASPPGPRSPTPIHRSPPPRSSRHRSVTGSTRRSGSSTRPANASSVPRSGVSSLTGIRIVASTDSFVAFIPFAALSPFHLWIFPVRHCSSFDEIEEYEITDLAVDTAHGPRKALLRVERPRLQFLDPVHPGEGRRAGVFPLVPHRHPPDRPDRRI